MYDRLTKLAGKNEKRIALLAARKERRSSRMRFVKCPACGEDDRSHRDKMDICDQCLADLWAAQSVLAKEFRRSTGEGLIPVKLAERSYVIEGPRLATSSYNSVPEEASFGRRDSRGQMEDSGDVMKELFFEIASTLAAVIPCDPISRSKADHYLPMGHGHGLWGDEGIALMLPAGTLKAIRDLYDAIEWHSYESFNAGFDAGRNLLTQLNLGGITHEAFLQEIEDQTAQRQERMRKRAGIKDKEEAQPRRMSRRR